MSDEMKSVQEFKDSVMSSVNAKPVKAAGLVNGTVRRSRTVAKATAAAVDLAGAATNITERYVGALQEATSKRDKSDTLAKLSSGIAATDDAPKLDAALEASQTAPECE